MTQKTEESVTETFEFSNHPELSGSEEELASKGRTRENDGREHNDDVHDVPMKLMLKTWAQSSTIHGLNFMTDLTFSRWKRVLWGCLTAVSAGLMIWQLYVLVEEYRNYEVTTSIHTIHPQSIPFPDVTVCNLNMFSASSKAEHNITEPRTIDELRRITQEQDDLVKATVFNTQPVLDASLWWQETITKFGRCYTFHTKKHVNIPGLLGGLLFYAKLNGSDYEEGVPYSGLQVFVLEPGTVVNSQTPFVAAKPGKTSLVDIDHTFVRREPDDPWSSCSGEAPAYTSERCREECLNAGMRTQCGCRLLGDALQPNMPLCTQEDNMECHDAYNKSRQLETCPECQTPPCSEKLYSTDLTELDFSSEFWKVFSKSSEFANMTQTEFMSDYVAVRVNFSKIQYQISREMKAFTFAQLLAAIGGAMGLFLGISALSVVEVADFCCLRWLPRMFGIRHVHGWGAKQRKADIAKQ